MIFNTHPGESCSLLGARAHFWIPNEAKNAYSARTFVFLFFPIFYPINFLQNRHRYRRRGILFKNYFWKIVWWTFRISKCFNSYDDILLKEVWRRIFQKTPIFIVLHIQCERNKNNFFLSRRQFIQDFFVYIRIFFT